MKLVLSGGGVKSISTLGALEIALRHYNFTHIVGTSAGSIIGALYCLNFSPQEMLRLLNLTKLPEVNSISMSNLVNNYGLSTTNDLWHTLEDIFEMSEISLNITLLELFNISGKLLEISGYNIEKNNTVFFNHLEFPDMHLLKAIAISCNIPLLFEPIEFNGDNYIDGCIMDNYPLSRFCYNDPKVLGISICSENKAVSINNIAEFIVYVMESVRQGSDRCQVRFNPSRSIDVFVPETINCLDFQLNEEEILLLFEVGKKSAEDYFKESYQVDFTNKSKARITFS